VAGIAVGEKERGEKGYFVPGGTGRVYAWRVLTGQGMKERWGIRALAGGLGAIDGRGERR